MLWGKKLSCVAFIVVFSLVGCGKDKKTDMSQPLYPTGQLLNSRSSTKTLNSEARFTAFDDLRKTSVVRLFNTQQLTRCRLYRDSNSQFQVFEVAFVDTTSNSRMELRVSTHVSNFNGQEVSGLASIFGDSNDGSAITVATGNGIYSNRLLEANNAKPLSSDCHVSYTLSSAGVSGNLYCSSLVNTAGEPVTTSGKFSCDGSSGNIGR